MDRSVWKPNERGVCVAVNRLRRTSTNTLPNINTPSFRVPDATLRVHVPEDVELPNTRCVADDSGHVAGSWIGINFERGEGRSEEDRARLWGERYTERGKGVWSRRDGKNYKGYL
jgi:hypothetical protein